MAEKKSSAQKETEKVYIEKRNRDDESRLVGINGKTWQVKCGEWVEVPVAVAEVLENAKMARKQAEDFIRDNRIS